MRTTDYSKLAVCTPLNQISAVVTGQAGCGEDQFGDVIATPGGQIRSRNPLPLRSVTKSMALQAEFKDFTGHKLGDLTVIGLLKPAPGGSGGGRGSRWVVRCACGTYETRRSKALKQMILGTKPPDELMCEECHHLQFSKARYSHKRRTGT